MGSKAQILAGFQVQSHSSSFQTPTCALQGQLEPQRMQSTSAGHLPSPASQPGNPGILTFSFLGRPEDKASSWAGRRSWHPPVPTVTAWGQKTRPLHLWQGCETRGQISALPLSAASPLALPAGQNEEPGETEAALQTSLESAGMLSHRPPTRGRLPGSQAGWPGSSALCCLGTVGFPLGSSCFCTGTCQGHHTAAPGRWGKGWAGSTHSSITSPWLQIKTISRPQFPLDTVLRGACCLGKLSSPSALAGRLGGGRTTSLVLPQVSYGNDARAGMLRPIWHSQIRPSPTIASKDRNPHGYSVPAGLMKINSFQPTKASASEGGHRAEPESLWLCSSHEHLLHFFP